MNLYLRNRFSSRLARTGEMTATGTKVGAVSAPALSGKVR